VTKRMLYRLLLSIMFFLLIIVCGILPEPANSISHLLHPSLFFVIATSIFCGGGFALFNGLVAPVVVYFLVKEVQFVPNVVVTMISLGITGFLTGVYYDWKNRPVLAIVLGVLASRFLIGLPSFVYYFAAGHYYTLLEFTEAAIFDVWPGLLISIILLPILYFMTLKSGILHILGRDY